MKKETMTLIDRYTRILEFGCSGVAPGTKLPLPTASQGTVAPELEGGLAPAPKGGLNGEGGPSPATYAF
jgi:hypothetical protein